MGFFSSKCEGCTKPVLSTYARILPVANWMRDAVVISPDGKITAGLYDGYGNVGGDEDNGEWDTGNRALCGATVWHAACWDLAGQPADFRGESANADDQGFFFNESKYRDRDPRTR